jgi:hypothetical protein
MKFQLFYYITIIVNNFNHSWMDKNLNCDLTSIYLVPNCIHYWSVNIQLVKQNFLRFLCWINNFTEKSVGSSIIINLLNGVENSNSTQLRTFFANQLHRQNAQLAQKFIFSMILVNCSNSCLLLINKLLQLFNYLSLSKKSLTEKIGNFTQSEDNIIADLIFQEINSNSFYSRKFWYNENTFDLYWSILMKLRYSILKCLIKDSFCIYENVMPIEYLQYIGNYYYYNYNYNYYYFYFYFYFYFYYFYF